MNYYKGYETNTRPFVLFELVAESFEELKALGLDNDPLVVTENQLMYAADPNFISYQFGICHKRIFNGILEDRPPAEISARQISLSKSLEIQKTKKVSSVFEQNTFSFDGKEFPMTNAARSIYTAVIDSKPATRKLITTTGSYILNQAQLEDFKEAYYNAVFAANDAELLV